MKTLIFNCISCKKEIEAAADLWGTNQNCIYCNNALTVPNKPKKTKIKIMAAASIVSLIIFSILLWNKLSPEKALSLEQLKEALKENSFVLKDPKAIKKEFQYRPCYAHSYTRTTPAKDTTLTLYTTFEGEFMGIIARTTKTKKAAGGHYALERLLRRLTASSFTIDRPGHTLAGPFTGNDQFYPYRGKTLYNTNNSTYSIELYQSDIDETTYTRILFIKRKFL